MPWNLPPVALAKAKALAVVAAALTAGGVGGVVALSQVQPAGDTHVLTTAADPTSTPTPDESTSPTAEASESADATPSPTQTDDPSPTASASASSDPSSSPSNHGACVSAVAHSAPRAGHGQHGKAVSAVAQSDCGKSAYPAESSSPEAGDGTDSPDGSDLRDGTGTPPAAPAGDDKSKHGNGHH